MRYAKFQSWTTRLGGYLLIPHELLHLLGFWLVGQPCKYRWGQPYVTPIGQVSRWQQLVGRLLPFVVFTLLFIICATLAGLAYGQARQDGSFLSFAIWLGSMQIAALYATTTFIDLRGAYLLVTNKPWHSHTPLDIFFWPAVDWDDVRARAAERGDDD